MQNVARNVDHALLYPVRDQPGVRPVGENDGGRLGILLSELQRFLAQAVVGAARQGQRAVCIHAVPRLDAGIEVEHAALHAVLDQHRARDVHRKVQEEVPLAQHRPEDLLDVVALDGIDDELDAVLFGFFLAAVVGSEDGNAVPRHVDVPQNEWEGPLSD